MPDPVPSTLFYSLNLPNTEIPLLSLLSDEEVGLDVKCFVQCQASREENAVWPFELKPRVFCLCTDKEW